MHKSFVGLVCAAILSSACGKDAVQTITAPAPPSAIKFFNFGVNAPGVNFYANDTKMTAITSGTGTESTTGVVYGGVGSGGFYDGISPGQYTLSGRIAAATDKDLAISNLSAPIADGKYYSYYLSGFYNTTAKTVDNFIVEDVLPQADFSTAYVRFVNAISNANPMTLYAKNTVTLAEVPVGAEIAYKGAGAFTALPPGIYDLSTRYAGTTTNAIARTGVSFGAGKIYTIGARGDITVTSTTATNRPFLDNTANR
ncbi:MAG: DUF4397 domain-containing protein [Gemmatimonadaceae bacterium]